MDEVTAGAALRDAAGLLKAAGVEGAERDARLLVAVAAGLSAAQLIAYPERVLTREQAGVLAQMIARRAAREPVSRILGERDFYGRTFTVTPDVLDPRADSETLIGAALDIAGREGWREAPVRVLDIGTGSGCLLVTLLAEMGRAHGVGTDVSAAALAVARRNAERAGVAPRAIFELAQRGVAPQGAFDLVVANLPYIPTADIATLAPEVRLHDPGLALDGGADGLGVIRTVADMLAPMPRPRLALFEVGIGQAETVADVLSERAFGLGRVEVWPDLAGVARCVSWQPHLPD